MADYNIDLGIDLNDLVSGINKAIDELNKLGAVSDKAAKELKDNLNKQNDSFKEQAKNVSLVNKEIIKESNSIDKLSKSVNQLKLARNASESAKEIKELNKLIDDGTQKINKLSSSTEKQRGVFGGLFNEAKAGLGRLLNPVNIAIGAAGGLAAGFLKVNNEIQRITPIARNLFSDTETDIDNVISKARQLSAAFGIELEDGLKTANVLTEQFGISADEAFELIEDGIAKGADLNGDFLDQLKEYSTQFRLAGLEADEAIAIITQQVNEGVFSDKGVDAIKEGTISLREFSKGTQDALKRIGIDTVKFQKDLESGNKTYFEGLQEIVSKTKEFGEDSEEAGVILADVFRGAGEDAGDFIFTLDTLNTNLDDIKDNSTDLQKAQRDLAKGWSEFTTEIVSGENALNTFFRFALEGISSLLDSINDAFKTVKDRSDEVLATSRKNAESTISSADDTFTRILSKSTKELEEALNRVKGGATIDPRDLSQLQQILNLRKKGLNDEQILLQRNLDRYKDYNEQKIKAEQAYQKVSNDTNEIFEGVSKNLANELGFLEANVKASQENLTSFIKTASKSQIEELKKLNEPLLNSIIKAEELNKKKFKPTTTSDSKDTITDQLKIQQKTTEEIIKQREQLEKEFSGSFDRLLDQVDKAAISGLEGEEKINAILLSNIDAISEQEDVLLELNSNLAEQRRKEAENTIKDREQLKSELERIASEEAENILLIQQGSSDLMIEAEKQANEEIKAFRDQEAARQLSRGITGIEESEEIAQLRTELELKQELGESEIEFEKRKQAALLEIQRKALEEKLALLQAAGGKENETLILQTKVALEGINKQIEEVNKPENYTFFENLQNNFNNGLKNILKVDDEQLQAIKSGFSDLVNNLVEIYKQGLSDQLADKQAFIDNINNQIDEQQTIIDAEIQLNKDGNASNIKAEKDKLKILQEEREKALEEQRKIQEEQRRIDTITQTISLITSAANIFKAFSAIPIVGVALGIAAVGAMFAAFIAAKSKAASSVTAETGAYGDSYGIIKGKRHYQGGERAIDHLEVEHGEAFSIYDRDTTRLNKPILKDWTKHINNDDLEGFIYKYKGSDVELNKDVAKNLTVTKLEIQKNELQIQSKGSDYSKLETQLSELIKLQKDQPIIIPTSNGIIVKQGNQTKRYAK